MTSTTPKLPARHLGVCYYPEQWDRSLWREDAKRMADLGLSRVRIAEFAWAFMEPEPGHYDWEWLDTSIETLAREGLKIVLGTPTATPPKWLIDQHPDILGYDRNLQPRRFGSRRHYCFSSQTYRRETARIVTAMAERYGNHDAVVAWQTDNEYGCHDTVRSYSPEAARAFRQWLGAKFETINALNEAWGTSFWSQQYRHFDQVDLPAMTVTEPNPSHVLDFYRFSSDQVVSFNRLQTEILRQLSPGRDLIHNYMGFFTDFDHFAVGDDLDVASWDSYPLGFLDVAPFPDETKRAFLRTGHPDFAAFYHDLYRAVGKGRWQIMEQQPGPVNWAHHNPAPAPGMVDFWSREAFRHGAEGVSYFRWRQAPFAQEQMHAGLMRPDNKPAPAYAEVMQVAKALADDDAESLAPQPTAKIAIVFSYEAQWLSEIQPHGKAWSYLLVCFEWYHAARQLGQAIDFVRPGGDLSGYELILVPSLPIIDEPSQKAFQSANGQLIFGPRSGSRTSNGHLPPELPPGPLQSFLPLKVIASESLPAGHFEEGSFNGQAARAGVWLDHIETDLKPLVQTNASDNLPARGLLYREGKTWLFTSCPDIPFLLAVLREAMND